MRRISLFLTPFVAITLSVVTAVADADQRPVETVSVDLILKSTAQKDNTGVVSAALVIRNTGVGEVKVEHPHNRMGVSFLVMNLLGNVVPPVGLAKIDVAFQKITIGPGEEYKQSFPKLEFLTGSALFGYELKPGETNRIVAVYRPNGKNSPGITSAEEIIEVK